jgi:ribosomal protein S18 acetylase RimI-like enzyme
MPLDRKLTIERLGPSHVKKEFDCGNPGLNDFIRRFAGQNAKKRFSTTYVVVESESVDVLGYFSISVGSIACELIPDAARKKLPRYPVPVVKLGRLAVDKEVQNQQIGRILLIDALKKIVSIAEEVAVFAVEVDALNEGARRFYKKFGFEELKDDKLHMYLPLKTLAKLFR